MRFVSAAAILSLMASGAWASTFSINTNPFLPAVTSSTPISGDSLDGNGIRIAQARAGASVGSGSLGYGNGQGSSSATSDITDIVFSGPGPFVQANITLVFDAFIGTYAEGWGSEIGTFGSSTFNQFQFSYGGLGPGGNFSMNLQTGQDPTFSNPEGLTYSFTLQNQTTQLLTNVVNNIAWAGVGVDSVYFLTGEIHFTQVVPTGTPLDMFFFIRTLSQGDAPAFSNAVASTDAMNTFGFAAGSGSFDLPEGYTVNAPSIGLVDGHIPGASVPESSSALLAGAGFLAMLAARAARRTFGARV
jgi:hypothetical protein